MNVHKFARHSECCTVTYLHGNDPELVLLIDPGQHQSDEDPSPPQGGAASGRRGGLVLQLDVYDNDVHLLQGVVTVPCYFLKDFLGLSFSSITIKETNKLRTSSR